jgi:hypothetical protein
MTATMIAKKQKARRDTGPSGATPVGRPAADSVAATPTKGEARSVASIETKLEKARTALKKLEDSWSYGEAHERKKELARLEVNVLEKELSTAQVAELPMPAAPAAASLQFVERSVPIAAIRITGNHREMEDDAETLRLARSIKTLGLQQRVGLRAAGDGSFELIWGWRRFRAFSLNAKESGEEGAEVPAKVYPQSLTAAEVEILRTIENFGRKDLTPVERAIAVARTIDAINKTLSVLIDKSNGPSSVPVEWPEIQNLLRRYDAVGADYASTPSLNAGISLARAIDDAGGLHAYVGLQLGFPARWVKDNAYVSRLGGEARKLLATHRIDVGHARELAKLGDVQAADDIARSVARNEKGLGGIDIERTRQMVIDQLRSLRTVPWRLDVAFGRGVMGCTGHACVSCPFNSKADPDLFGGALADEPEAGVCRNGACFAAKQRIVEKDIEGFVAKAKVAVKKGLQLTELHMSHLIPIHVKGSSAIRKAKKEIEPQKPKEMATGTVRRTPEELAKEKFQAKLGEWERGSINAIEKVARNDYQRLIALVLLNEHPVFGGWNWHAKEVKKHWRDLERAAASGDDDIIHLAGLVGKSRRLDFQIFLANEESRAQIIELFAQEWDLELRAKPKLEDFLPKKKDEVPAKGKQSTPPAAIKMGEICKLHPKPKKSTKPKLSTRAAKKTKEVEKLTRSSKPASNAGEQPAGDFDDDELEEATKETVVNNPGRVILEVQRRRGGRWASKHFASVGKGVQSKSEFDGHHPDRATAIVAAADRVHEFVQGILNNPKQRDKFRDKTQEILRALDAVDPSTRPGEALRETRKILPPQEWSELGEVLTGGAA